VHSAAPKLEVLRARRCRTCFGYRLIADVTRGARRVRMGPRRTSLTAQGPIGFKAQRSD
jgi:hypothetical protein